MRRYRPVNQLNKLIPIAKANETQQAIDVRWLTQKNFRAKETAPRRAPLGLFQLSKS